MYRYLSFFFSVLFGAARIASLSFRSLVSAFGFPGRRASKTDSRPINEEKFIGYVVRIWHSRVHESEGASILIPVRLLRSPFTLSTFFFCLISIHVRISFRRSPSAAQIMLVLQLNANAFEVCGRSVSAVEGLRIKCIFRVAYLSALGCRRCRNSSATRGTRSGPMSGYFEDEFRPSSEGYTKTN